MANRPNFQKELEREIESWQRKARVPSLLLHSCCAPCSSYVLEYLSQFMKITVFYYNPNIYPPTEYAMRTEEQQRLISSLPARYPISFLEGRYRPEEFYRAVQGLEKEAEGGERCKVCFRLRLAEAAKAAKELGCDYVTTTLSISPMKDAERLNAIGSEEAQKQGILYLYSDFKKKNGYRRSVELSKEYGLYRQDYCGCVFSKRSRENGAGLSQ
ncbi:MAG: epoxyqueuosine reductase QueH [bacterium]|nr:epoxyqueuosine reductase QueH [bacterium]